MFALFKIDQSKFGINTEAKTAESIATYNTMAGNHEQQRVPAYRTRNGTHCRSFPNRCGYVSITAQASVRCPGHFCPYHFLKFRPVGRNGKGKPGPSPVKVFMQLSHHGEKKLVRYFSSNICMSFQYGNNGAFGTRYFHISHRRRDYRTVHF